MDEPEIIELNILSNIYTAVTFDHEECQQRMPHVCAVMKPAARQMKSPVRVAMQSVPARLTR
jgi:hypothetical protein